jgi:arsenical pump membrane protein
MIILLAVFLLTIAMILVNQRVVYHKTLRFLDVSYYLAPVIGCLIIFIFGLMTPADFYYSITGSRSLDLSFLYSNGPFSVVVLFLSITFIAVALDVTGFFEYLAVKVLEKVQTSGTKIFIAIYAFTSFLTLFTSNDILILTLTPFLLVFLRHLKVNPLPFLIAEFFAANTLSMGLLIGNPTNIIVGAKYGIDFVTFAKIMLIPSLVAGLSTFLLLYFIFRKEIRVKCKAGKLPDVKMNFWSAIGVVLLLSALVSLAVVSELNMMLWQVALLWAVLTFFVFSFCKDSIPKIIKKMPWEIIPFVLGFFAIIYAFEINGVSEFVGRSMVSGNVFQSVFSIGILSAFAANIFNNIPMTVFFSSLISGFSGAAQTGAAYALVMGSNLGANLTPIGALAGIMWLKILKHGNVKISFKQFASYGIRVIIPAALLTLLAIYLMVA